MKRGVRFFKSLRFVSVLFSLLALCVTIAFGQAISGNLVGTVSDPSSAVVSNAEVTATNVGTGATATASTNATGEYRFDNLPVGTYKITVKVQGFRTTVEQTDVELNKTGTRNIRVTPGAATETVEVTGAAPTIDTTTAQLQSTFDPQYSQDLGLTSTGGAGAGVLNLSLLTPGVTNGSAMGDGVGPSVGGQRPRDNNFTVEGVDNNNKSVTGALITVPPEAVENFTLLSNQFNSEFGHSSGGQFNTTVKSGTNRFHGSVYEYFRNRNLNAVDETWVQQGLTTNPRFDANRYGGTFGGPIIKNKLFFFTNFERNPIGFISVGGGAVQAPTTAGLAAMGADPNLNATNFGIFQKYIPLATTPSGCITYNGTSNGISLGGNAFQAPANGSCAAGSVEVGNVPIIPAAWQSWTNFVQSVDYNMSDKDQIRGRFIYNKENLLDNQAQLGTFFAPYSITYELINASEYHTFTPSVTNEFRVGFNRFDETIPAGNFSYPGLDAFPNITLFDLGNGLNVGPDGNAPQFTIQNFYQFVDNVSIVKGKHTLKVGGEYRWYISPQGFTQRSRGDYEYNGTQVYLEDLAPDNFGQRSTGSSTYYGNDKAIYFFVNDTWRVNQHLSLNAGVRYEYTTTPTGENRQTLNAISNTPSILVPQAGNQPLVFGKVQPAKNNWAPRIGFAYSPGSSGNTSIRGGFGMAYDTLYDNIGSLAVPPQIGSTENVAAGLPAPNVAPLTPDFLSNGGLPPGGGSGITILSKADAIANTANWLPNKEQDPYSINWNIGVQHAFGKNYSAEINYVGTRGIHLPMQDIINLATIVTPANALPTYTQAPDQATLDALPNNLNNLLALQNANIVPANYTNAGFTNAITAFVPRGQSSYNGLQAGLSRRFSNGLTFQSAYTWSHTIDNSTADFHTTDITPRRPQDFLNFASERSNSALDRAQRFTLAMVYELPFFKGGNWMMKNVVGNWTFSPVYAYETGEWVTVQAQQDANLNGDPAGDRAIVNPAGVRGTGSDVTALCRVSNPCDPNTGVVVAYMANNPTAQYIRTGLGALSNAGRNTLQTPGTNNIDLGIYKDLSITESMKFRFGAQFGNIINHPQFIPGSNPGFGLGVNDVNGFSSVGTGYKAFVTPGNANFNNPSAVFASNARTIALMAKFSF
jgi:Carboxypeptidase regulatory-like domain/TonB dependent receptor